MCGIVGIISKNESGFGYDESQMFTQMLQMNTIRGEDSTGAFGVTKEGLVDIIKADTNGWNFTTCKNYQDFHHRIYSSYRMVIGHNRAATTGTVKAENAHPFKEKNIVLVHNGTIRNKDALAKDVEVDSHAITIALSKADAAAGLSQIDGPFALVWYDTERKLLNLARNIDRPLFLLEYSAFYAVASEPGLPYWLAGRMNNKIMKTPEIIPIERIVQFHLDTLQEGKKEVTYENYTSYVWPEYSRHSKPAYVPPIGESIKTQSSPLKVGDNVEFTVDDIKHEPGDKDWTLFGHPIFDKEIYANILVKMQVTSEPEMKHLTSTGILSGYITSIAQMGNMPVFFVRFATVMYHDRNKHSSVKADIEKAIANGCGKCHGTMAFTEIADSIIRKKKDGTYRTLCSKCLAESIANIGKENIVA